GMLRFPRRVERPQPLVVERLLARGADPAVADDEGLRPLDAAREAQHAELVRVLERHGAR
ncbi:MAG TPA: hypothetical protein VM489_05040, partial [Burkholderiales bacterium]|nr:hypothetical protein [Burkholderiales bacterium]